jgi:hypothetical protein
MSQKGKIPCPIRLDYKLSLNDGKNQDIYDEEFQTGNMVPDILKCKMLLEREKQNK